VLGFRWTAHPLTSQGSGPGGSAVTAGSMCCSLDGQLVLVSAANEIARLAVVADCALPVPPASLYNARLAAAALESAARRTASGAGGYPARPDSQASKRPRRGGWQREGEGGPSNAFGRFVDQAASTVTGLATTAAGTVMQVSGYAGAAAIVANKAVCFSRSAPDALHSKASQNARAAPCIAALPLALRLQELDRARAVGQGALQRIGIESGGPSRSLPTLEVRQRLVAWSLYAAACGS